MNIGGRYKQVGKKRHAILEMSYDEVMATFEKALKNTDESRLVSSVNRETGVFKIEYKFKANKKDTYESYCLLVEVSEVENGLTKIEYVFVYDRLTSVYTKVLSLICFTVPVAAAALVYFKFLMRSPIHLVLYIPLALVALFGLFSLFGYKERRSDVEPMVREFEQLLVSSFEE
jgi:hypothetical protein